jgi:TldD protein
MSWNGIEMVAEEASRSGTGGLELATLEVAEISAAVRRALALLAGAPSSGRELEVVLAPSVVAALFARGVVDLLDARRWQSAESRMSDFAGDLIADQRVSLTDDPTVDGGYGSYDFDDEGWLSARRPLIHRGVLLGPLTDRRSAAAIGLGRTGHGRLGDSGVAPRPSNLAIERGDAATADLIKSVKVGYLIEGSMLARCDPLRWRVIIRARRAREIRDGSLSGRVLGPVSVRADVKSLLLGVRRVGAERAVFTLDGGSSIAAPHLLTRAEVSG